MSQQLFVFVQFEFPWLLGPADGRYLLRHMETGEPEYVVVLGGLEAGRLEIGGRARGAGRGPLGRRGKRETDVPSEPQPASVPTSRVTVIDPVSLSAEGQARAWLAELDREREVRSAIEVVNRVIHAHRIAAADPYMHEVAPAQAIAIRAGWGEGEQVADGRWLHARALLWKEQSNRPIRGRRTPGRSRSAALRPQERLATLLAARASALLCEEIALRAREDLDAGRTAHAALELERAYALAARELKDESRQDLAIRVAELEQLRDGVQTQARAAMANRSEALDADAVGHALQRLEAALRARSAGAG